MFAETALCMMQTMPNSNCTPNPKIFFSICIQKNILLLLHQGKCFTDMAKFVKNTGVPVFC